MNQTFIFIGRSGCGKGTQAEMLKVVLAKKAPDTPIVHLETGKLFREFIKTDNYTENLSRKINESGGLQPEFLTVHLWSQFFVKNMRENVNLVLDGTPRKLFEAKILHTALEFYSRTSPKVIFLNVSRAWSEARMLERKRADDNKRDIKARLDWFDKEVMPAVEFLRNDALYDFHEVNGERTVDEIHQDIVKLAGLL